MAFLAFIWLVFIVVCQMQNSLEFGFDVGLNLGFLIWDKKLLQIDQNIFKFFGFEKIPDFRVFGLKT